MLSRNLRERCTPPQPNLLLLLPRRSRSKRMLQKPPEDHHEVLIGKPIPHTKQERREPMARMMCIKDIIRGIRTQGENPIGPESISSTLEIIKTVSFKVIVTNVGVRDTLLKTVEPLPILSICIRSFMSSELKTDRLITLRTPIMSQIPPHILRTLRTT